MLKTGDPSKVMEDMSKFKFKLLLVIGMFLCISCQTKSTKFVDGKAKKYGRSTLKIKNYRGEVVAIFLIQGQPALGNKTELRLDSGQVIVYYESTSSDYPPEIHIDNLDDYK